MPLSEHVNKIIYITGTRADYGLMRSTLRSIEKRRNLALSLIVTGMHLSKEFGYSIREVQRGRFKIAAKIPTLLSQDTGTATIKSFGSFVVKLADVLEKLDPDMLLLLGDRWEMMAGALVGAYTNRLVVHIAGGEASGSIDEPNRHVITRFAHLHLVANEEYARRLIRMGEERNRIHVVGAPGLDDIVEGNYCSPSTIEKEFGIDSNQPLLLVVQHPVLAEYEDADHQMETTLRAVTKIDCQAIVIYPNADPGGRRMIKVINRYQRKFPFLRSYENLPREAYLGLMAVSSVIIGNSSSGLAEAPSFRLPVVNVGTRQSGRIRAKNVIDVGYDTTEIVAAIEKALSKEFTTRIKNCVNPYGDGKTGSKIAAILGTLEINSGILQKRLAY
jgi:UDP-N-acetylglucosamine 2-epimerase (non-hydrolysing)/GDP/UDP-N,N'-diacetylbacillosamine 2-epimerase (hydrolysing)